MATLFMLYILRYVSDDFISRDDINRAQVPPTKDTGTADITMECIPNNQRECTK